MAGKRERPAHGFYKLSNISPAVKCERLPAKKPYLEGDFFIERIISRRGQGKGKEYLIKWDGYSRAACTWEPQEHIPQHLIRSLYDSPKPSSTRVEEAVVKFLCCLKKKLKSKSLDPICNVDMDHDVFRFLFNGKGRPASLAAAILLDKHDFDKMPMLDGSWWYCLKKNGEGSKVDFPIRAKAIVRKSTSHYTLDENNALVQAPSFIQEIVSFYITTNPCSVDSLIEH